MKGEYDVHEVDGERSDLNWRPTSPDERTVNSCHGHCGAGCHGSKCGARNYWIKDIRGPVETDVLEGTECIYDGLIPADWPGGTLEGELHSFTATRLTAPGTWTFYGATARACAEHDSACRMAGTCINSNIVLDNLWALILVLFRGCGTLTLEDWSYPETFYHWTRTDPWPTGQSCQVWVGSTTG